MSLSSDEKQIFYKLKSNPKDSALETIETLIKIGNNILQNPSNLKFRTLQKNNINIKNKVLNISGGSDCLKLMGFIETETTFYMPTTQSLPDLKAFIFRLNEINCESPQTNVIEEIDTETNPIEEDDFHFKMIKRPPINYHFANSFLQTIEKSFDFVMIYEDKDLQKFAKSLIPLEELQMQALENMRLLQRKMKKENVPDNDYGVQDFLMLELISWFKNDFFEWVDRPKCEHCNGQTQMSHYSTDPDDLVYTDRVEVYKCTQCTKSTNFPRYNDPYILLHTRRGRCGEWANVFTLFCRAIGWEARYVVDATDHVWTEVYSIGRRRWIHCDSTEGCCDRPLLYESGWGKKLTYIIAYGCDDIQDVTWRYSSDHRALLTRRTNCTEEELRLALTTLRNERQKNVSKRRCAYLIKRSLFELVEFLVEKKPSDYEKVGRISGSLDWRMARGEASGDNLFYWQCLDENIVNNRIVIKYSSAKDQYIYETGKRRAIVNGWNEGVFTFKNIFRKEESDWKMVYLSRNEGASCGSIIWKYSLESESKVINGIRLKFDYKTFEGGVVVVKIVLPERTIEIPKNETVLHLDNLGCNTFQIIAELSKGKGESAWQHSQLFRQEIGSQDFPFVIELLFKNK